MSRTDKDIPQWVAQRIVGRVEHDHRNGVCDVERIGEPELSRRHAQTCRKIISREQVMCRHDKEGHLLTPGVICSRERRYAFDDDDALRPIAWWHETMIVVRDEMVECACDTLRRGSVFDCDYDSVRAYEHPAGIYRRRSGYYACGCCEVIDRAPSRRVIRQHLAALTGRLDVERVADFDEWVG